jgi:hypothetical protein
MKVPIAVITNNRKSRMGAMNPNLMGTAGFKLCLNQGHRPVRIDITVR